jgi:hypothetical protein
VEVEGESDKGVPPGGEKKRKGEGRGDAVCWLSLGRFGRSGLAQLGININKVYFLFRKLI